jgi:hypothetical protein
MPLLPDAPDPTVVHSVAGQPRVVFLRPLVSHPTRAEQFLETPSFTHSVPSD